MTIEDQIKDEKLQYDINREAAKISALSSGKIDKYEYLTGEKILPSNQQQIVQQAKVTYSPLGKALEKQKKTIEDQGEKQVKSIQDKQIVNINKNDYKDDYKDKLLLSKEREIFKDIYNKRLDRIEELNNKIDYNNLEYTVYSRKETINFSELKDPLALLDEIKKGKMTLERNKKGNKNVKQRETLANLNMFYTVREEAIKFIEDYGSMILKAKKPAREQEGIGLKILTPNQMLKRLSIALAQVRAGNNSESLLNEIRHIVYYLYRSKEVTKKVYNNIINSVKV